MYLSKITRNKIILKPFCINRTIFVFSNGYCGSITVDNEKFKISEKIHFLIPAGRLVGCELIKNTQDNFIHFLSIKDEHLETVLKSINYLKETNTKMNESENILFIKNKDIEDIFEINQILKDSKISIDKFQAHLLRCIKIIMEIIQSQGYDINIILKSTKYCSTKEKLYKMFINDPKMKWTLEKVSKELFISQSSLRRQLLKESTSFIKILNDVRLGVSLNYLTFTKLPISKVSELSGFNSTAYYCSTFKKKYRKTPLEFREHSRSKNDLNK